MFSTPVDPCGDSTHNYYRPSALVGIARTWVGALEGASILSEFTNPQRANARDASPSALLQPLISTLVLVRLSRRRTGMWEACPRSHSARRLAVAAAVRSPASHVRLCGATRQRSFRLLRMARNSMAFSSSSGVLCTVEGLLSPASLFAITV